MQYPREFSEPARAAVEAELIRSRRRHDDRKQQWESDWPFPNEESVRTCIMECFLVYALETIELGSCSVWTADQVRHEAAEGLRCLTIEIGSKTDYQHFIERGCGSITPEARRAFEATSEWRQFEDEFLALADSRLAPAPLAGILGAAAKRAVSSERTRGPVARAGSIFPAPKSFNRLIQKRLGSDHVADVKLPKFDYEFPFVFSQAHQAKVTSARLQAEDVFAERKGSIRQFAEAESLLLELMLQVFIAFAETACGLGIQGVFSVSEVESECLRFLKSYSTAAGLTDRYQLVPLGIVEIPIGLQKDIEATDQWKQYRRLLQTVAETQAASTPELRDDEIDSESALLCPPESVSTSLKLDIERINHWIENEGYRNSELAESLKISERAVSSIRNNGEYHGRDAVIKLANLMCRRKMIMSYLRKVEMSY